MYGALLLGSTVALGSLLWYLKQRRSAKILIFDELPEQKKRSSEQKSEGKVAIVTGANCGLGLETSRELVERGFSVVFACRSQERASDAIASILKLLPPTDSSKLSFIPLDLADKASVESFVEAFSAKFNKLDLLVNNAGIMSSPYQLSKDGVELHFAINHLGHFCLTNLLLPSLRNSKSSRVVIVSSGYYRKMKTAKFEHLTDQDIPSDYDPLYAYARSKLANCLHTFQLAKKEPQIGVYAVRPGFVGGTNLGRYFSTVFRLMGAPLIWYFSKNIHQGVQTILYCSLTPMDKLKSGRLYDNCSMEEYTQCVNDENANALWELSEKLLAAQKN